MSHNRKIDSENLVHLHNGILLNFYERGHHQFGEYKLLMLFILNGRIKLNQVWDDREQGNSGDEQSFSIACFCACPLHDGVGKLSPIYKSGRKQ